MVKARANIAVIGDSNIKRGSAEYRLAEAIGRELVNAGYRVLTGGMQGIMEAALRGAKTSPRYRPGDTIALLPGADPAKANRYADIIIPTGLDHLRNSVVAHAAAVVAVGGGAGTLSEICFAWIYRRPIIGLTGVKGWSARLAGKPLDGRNRFRRIPEDCIYAASSAAEVAAILKEYLHRYVRQGRQ